MDFAQLRKENLALLNKECGVSISDSLLLLDSELAIRTKDEVVSRTLALFAVVSCSYGYDVGRAMRWLEREKLYEALTPLEVKALKSYYFADFQVQIEALWALCWALGLVSELRCDEYSPDDFVLSFPNLLQDEGSADFRTRASMRSLEQIAQQCDAYYCLHWASIADGRSRRKSSVMIELDAIVQRRIALEWLSYDEEWDDVPLDT